MKKKSAYKKTWRRIFPPVRVMTWDETRDAGLMNPGLVMEYCHLKIPLSAGYSDGLMIWSDGYSLMVMVLNEKLEYVGLEEIDILDGKVIGGVFLMGYQLRESLGSRWRQMKPETIRERLKVYL